MDNNNQNTPQLPKTPLPLTTPTNQAPQPPTTFSANSLNLANPPKNSKKVILYIGLVIIIMAILIGALAIVQNIDNNNSPKLKTSAPTTTNNNGVVNPDQNPLNNNGPINAQVKYCSNPVNAELVC